MLHLLEDSYLDLKIGKDSVRLAFVTIEENIYVVSSDFESRWPSTLMRIGECSVKAGSARKTAYPVMVKDRALKSNILSALILKYGRDKFEKWFPNPSRFFRLSPFRVNVLSDESGRYFSWLEDEFDSIADEYDTHIFGNSINVYLRDRSLRILTRVFSRKSYLLEIGSGSGAETMEMLKQGNEVLAVDISESMLEVLRRKARNLGLEEALSTVKIRASNLHKLSSEYSGTFDGIYSTYGAINCEPDITMLPDAFNCLTKGNASVLLGLYNKLCISDPLLHAVGLKPRRVLERMRNPIPEGRSRFCIDVYAYTPSYITSLFKKHFRGLSLEGVPVILPPSNYDTLAKGILSVHRYISRVDTAISKYFPFNLLGDHFLLLMQKKSPISRV